VGAVNDTSSGRLAGALTSYRLLSAGSTQMMMTGKVAMFPGPGVRYGFGFEDARDKDGNGWVGHPGGGPGINGELRIYPKYGYVVAVLANLDWPAASRIADYLDPRLPRTLTRARSTHVSMPQSARAAARGDRSRRSRSAHTLTLNW